MRLSEIRKDADKTIRQIFKVVLMSNDERYYQKIDNYQFFLLFKYIFNKKKFPKRSLNFEDEIYDIYYWRDRRQGDRQRKLKKFFNPSLRRLLIGWCEDDNIGNLVCHKKMPHKETMEIIQNAKSSIIIGDDEHNGNITTFRFYESIKMGLVTFIDSEYDPRRKLIKDPRLQNFLYVNSMTQLANRARGLNENSYKKIIKLQDEELKHVK